MSPSYYLGVYSFYVPFEQTGTFCWGSHKAPSALGAQVSGRQPFWPTTGFSERSPLYLVSSWWVQDQRTGATELEKAAKKSPNLHLDYRVESLETTVQILLTDMAHWSHPELMWKTPAMFQQSRKFAAMSSSRAISGGMGNSGISVDELVYLVFYTINTFQLWTW